MKKRYGLSASLISTSLSDISQLLKELKKNKINYIHFDVMDGQFVPRFGLPPEMIKIVKKEINVPVNVHLMIEKPEAYIEEFAKTGADIITVHAESTNHLHRCINLIRSMGLKAGVALNPATPLNALDYIVDQIDLVMLMAINPGIVGHRFIEKTYQKIKDLNEKIEKEDILIEIDGGVNFDTAPKMISAGADILVCGSQSIFKDKKLKRNISTLRKIINNDL